MKTNQFNFYNKPESPMDTITFYDFKDDFLVHHNGQEDELIFKVYNTGVNMGMTFEETVKLYNFLEFLVPKYERDFRILKSKLKYELLNRDVYCDTENLQSEYENTIDSITTKNKELIQTIADYLINQGKGHKLVDEGPQELSTIISAIRNFKF